MLNDFIPFLPGYHVGGPLGWSDVFFFRALPDGTDWQPSIALYGDMGNKNAQSLARLQEDILHEYYHAIFHVGKSIY
jgi:hypothetical protein